MAAVLQIGGTEEYKICQAINEGRITKPVVCWCIGTCATMFASEVKATQATCQAAADRKRFKFSCCYFSFTPQVQFGHAGACANQASETAVAKNKALKEAGAFVPNNFDQLGEIIKSVEVTSQ